MIFTFLCSFRYQTKHLFIILIIGESRYPPNQFYNIEKVDMDPKGN